MAKQFLTGVDTTTLKVTGGSPASGKVLTSDGSGNATWATATAGQTLVTKIVAASGGDYTTLGAALTAASAGWTIYVVGAVTESGTITSSLTDITVVGNGRNSKITLGGNTTLSGDRVRIQNMQVAITSTFGFVVSGNNTDIQGCTFVRTSGSGQIQFGATHCNFVNNRVECNTGRIMSVFGNNHNVNNNVWYLSLANTSGIDFAGYNNSFVGNMLELNTASSPTAQYMLDSSGTNNSIIGNSFSMTSSSFANGIRVNGANSRVVGNFIESAGSALTVQSTRMLVDGNTFYGGHATLPAINIAGDMSYSVISNNLIQADNGGSSVGVKVITGNFLRNILSGNQFYTGTVTGIHLTSATSASYNTITHNQLRATTTPIADTSNLNTYADNEGASKNFERAISRMTNSSGSSLAVGDVVVFDTTSAAGESVTTSTTAGDNRVFGMAAEAITAGSSGSIMTLGKTVSLKADGTTDIAVGDYLSQSTTAGIAKKATAGETAFAIALEAFTTDATSGVLDARLISPRMI